MSIPSSQLRPITPADHAAVLALNERNVELLAPLDEDKLTRMTGIADRASVITHENSFAGFVITFAAGTAYDSTNYQWYADTYDSFYYLDRIVLHDDFRRLGLGSIAYDELEGRARELAPRLALEVNLDPPNEPSLAFHRKRGYEQIGEAMAGEHLVAMLVKTF
jgi:predicted GNAT superfamily acetyltransferase